MPNKKALYKIDFDQYIIVSEPSKRERGKVWQAAIGLQQVDGLTPSPYLYETARRNIDGEISIATAKYLIDGYYESKDVRESAGFGTEEADKVSVRIAEILGEQSFSFTPMQLLSIHGRLFKGILPRSKTGAFRTYNITKKEWALDGDTVLYANADLIRQTLEYDFETERNFDYSSLTREETVAHIARFVANIWQVHPFAEGNTRTTAVFTVKYLRSLGFAAANEIFEENSWYFRNSLVRANYSNVAKKIYAEPKYLVRFFRNLMLGEENELKSRFTHIRYDDVMSQKVAINAESGDKIAINGDSGDKSTIDMIIAYINENNAIDNSAAQQITGLSPSGVRRIFAKLVAEDVLEAHGANRNRTYSLKK